MSDKMIAACKALAKGEQATVPAMKFNQFPIFVAYIKQFQEQLSVK